MKTLRYKVEAFFARIMHHVFGFLPLPVASSVGGLIAKAVGPHTRVHRIAEQNLQCAMPQLNDAERKETLRRMWDNLGRVFCEYPHLSDPKMMKRVDSIRGLEHFEAARIADAPVFFVSGHLGNWELPPVVAAEQKMPIHLLYRAANNPEVDALVAQVRSPYTLGLHDKGRRAARAIVSAIANHEPVGMLVDQKTNNGIAIDFFGKPAMTSDVIAHLVIKYQPIVLPVRCVRTGGCRFRIEVEPPMEFVLSGDHDADTRSIMRQVHTLLERWISQDPSQWFWVHKRWPFSNVKQGD